MTQITPSHKNPRLGVILGFRHLKEATARQRNYSINQQVLRILGLALILEWWTAN
jgi:hypothetical protein